MATDGNQHICIIAHGHWWSYLMIDGNQHICIIAHGHWWSYGYD